MTPLSRKSKRLGESSTIKLTAQANDLKALGHDLASLTVGETDFPTPAAIKEAAAQAIAENFTRYTANRGILPLREAISRKLKNENGIDCGPERIVVSCGTKHAVHNVLHAMLNPGDEVVIPSPYYVSYPEMVRLADGVPVIVKTRMSEGFKMSADMLRAALTRKTKLLILNSPSNPAGIVYTPDELKELADTAAAKGVYIISDEIYEKILFGKARTGSIGAVEAVRDRVITVNGFSKSYAMTGWRIGYAAGPKEIMDQAEKLQAQMTNNASSISQKAALAALTLDTSAEVSAMVKELEKRRAFVMKAMEAVPGVSFVPPDGAFYVFLNVKEYLGGEIATSEQLCERLLTRHLVAVVPGTGFGHRNFIRISFGGAMAEVKKGIERLQEGFAELR